MLAICRQPGDDLVNERLAPPGSNSPCAIVVHVLEELVQHRGQLEVTADVLRHRAAAR